LFLLVLQGSNYIIPLITLPYLVRTLGPEKFGLLAFSQALIQYFIILTDFGFDLSATRQISINRSNLQSVSNIFSTVMFIKISIFLLGFLVFVPTIYFVPNLKGEQQLMYWFYLSVLAQVLFPTWIFQGLETMKYITYLNIISKVLFNSLILFLIKTEENYTLYPILLSLTSLSASFVGVLIVTQKLGIKPTKIKLENIIYQLKEGWYIFISNVTISLYTISSTIVLGLLFNNRIVGYYASADRIIKAFQGLLSPFTQALYPHISKLFTESRKEAVLYLRKTTLFVGLFTFTVSVSVFFAANFIITELFEDAYEESVSVLQILAWIPFLVSLSNIFGIQTMLNLNYKRQFFRILLVCSVIHIFTMIFLSYYLKHNGVAIAVVFTELLITLSMFRFLLSKKINLIKI
jgi:polysaccharide transporter, PST family